MTNPQPSPIRRDFLQIVHDAWDNATDEQRAKAITATAERVARLEARIGNETAAVHEVVGVDIPDNRVYVKTWEESEVFCLPLEAVEVAS